MTLEKKLAAVFSMSDEVWARHANPWSVWTRFTVLPVLILAFWSRVWLDWWSLIPIGLAIFWTWLNPRFFQKPYSTNNWASKGVLGERVWSNRDEIPVPEHHRRVPRILSSVSGIGGIFIIWGVITLAVWPTVFGFALIDFGKLWFIDRMVWLYEDMKDANEEYANWLY